MKKPSGMVAVLTRGDGVVMATAADFDPKSPGYDTIKDAQRGRARQALSHAFVLQFCGPDIADVLTGYAADRLIDGLCERKGYRVTIMVVGGEDA